MQKDIVHRQEFSAYQRPGFHPLRSKGHQGVASSALFFEVINNCQWRCLVPGSPRGLIGPDSTVSGSHPFFKRHLLLFSPFKSLNLSVFVKVCSGDVHFYRPSRSRRVASRLTRPGQITLAGDIRQLVRCHSDLSIHGIRVHVSH